MVITLLSIAMSSIYKFYPSVIKNSLYILSGNYWVKVSSRCKLGGQWNQDRGSILFMEVKRDRDSDDEGKR